MNAHCPIYVAFEGPGYFADWFGSRGVELQYWKPAGIPETFIRE